MTIELVGKDELFRFMNTTFKKDAMNEMERILFRMSIYTQKTAVNSIQAGSRSGRTYKRRSVYHTASRAGEPPKTDTGNLVNNITFDRVNKFEFTTGSRKGAPYGKWLEFGTRKMGKRPWLTPAYNQTLVKFRTEFK